MAGRLHWGRVTLVCALAAVAVVLGAISFHRRLQSTEPRFGVEWVQGAGGPMVLAVDPDGAGAQAGLFPGDLLLEVEGHSVRSVPQASDLLWNLPPGTPVHLTVARGSRHFEVRVLPRSVPGAPALYGYLALVGLACFVSSLFISFRWPNVRGGTVYVLFSAALAVQLVLSHTGRGDVLDWIVYWGDVAAGSLAPALLLHLAVVFARRDVPFRRMTLFGAYGVAAGLLGANVWLVGLGGAYRFADPVAAAGWMDRGSLLYLGIAVPLALFLLARTYLHSSSGLHRSRVRLMLWGLGAGLGPFTAVYAIPWGVGASVPGWSDLSVLPLLLVPAAFTASMARYRLNDMDLLVRTGFAEVAAVFLTLAVYAATVAFLRQGAGDWLALSRSATRYAGILLALMAYPKMRRWSKAAVERAFYRRRYSYRATLLDWASELNAETDLDSLAAHVVNRVVATLGVPRVALLVRAGADRFETPGASGGAATRLGDALVRRLESEPYVSLDADALPDVPWAAYLFGMRVKGSVRAVLAVAEREREKEPLSGEDRALLATLSAHAASAIEAARLLREVRKQASELREMKDRQERILESSKVGLMLLDAEGTVLAWNRALEEIYGLPRREAIGRRVGDVLPLHVVRVLEQQAGAAGPGEEVRVYRHPLVNHVGRRLVANLTVSSVGGSGPGPGARVVTVDDVTERVGLEEQLLQKERLAALGLLAAGVAHEVNTPLTGISGYAQLLLEESPLDDPAREILARIEKESRRASQIANSLLELARPERGCFEPLSLNEVVRDVLRLFEPQIPKGGVRVEAKLAEGLAPIRGHRGKLEQVLLNLLANARDAVAGDGSIRVATRDEGDRVVLEVVDDGSGIPREDLPRIFDPFFTTKGRRRGTGLGLSITWGIVREHDAEIHVESVPGEFTRFRVEFPVAAGARALA